MTRAGHVPTFSSRFVNREFQPFLKKKYQVVQLVLKGKNESLFRLRYFSFFKLPLFNDLNFINGVNEQFSTTVNVSSR